MRRISISVTCALALCTSATVVPAQDQPMVGAPAPGFELETLDGERVALEDFRGRIVVLHFGAGW